MDLMCFSKVRLSPHPLCQHLSHGIHGCMSSGLIHLKQCVWLCNIYCKSLKAFRRYELSWLALINRDSPGDAVQFEMVLFWNFVMVSGDDVLAP